MNSWDRIAWPVALVAVVGVCLGGVAQAEETTGGSRIMLPSAAGLIAVPRPAAAVTNGRAAVSSSTVAPSGADVAGQARALLKLVVAGPTKEEQARGIYPAFPEGATLADVLFDPARGYLRVKLDLPASFLADPGQVRDRSDWISDSVIKTTQRLPIRGWEIWARRPGSTDYVPLDSFLPKPAFTPYKPTSDTAAIPKEAAPQGAPPTELPAYEPFPRPGSGRPTGALSGKAVYLNPGHGRVWGTDTGGDYWRFQRGFVQDNCEDLSNVDLVNQWLFAYCYNAGADVFSVRELDPNPNMVIVDNDDGNDGTKGYFETGAWSDSAVLGFANGHSPYVTGQDPFSYGTNRLATCVVGSPTRTATWIPQIPAAGWYNVYVSHAAYSNRSPQAHYRIYHAGGSTDYYLDQRMRRFTWIFIGAYYFEAGVNPDTGKVVLYNDSSSTAHYVSADAVRFGGGMGLIKRGAVGVSGERRYDEESRYHEQFSGAPTSVYDAASADEHDGWSGRPSFGEWLKQGAGAYGAPAQDSVFLSSHTNAGGGSGLDSFVYTGYSGTWHDDFRNFVHDEVLNDLSKGYDASFQNHGAGKKYGTYGENYPPYVNNEMPIFLGEWLFHDSAADMALYHDPQFRRMMARAICQGIVKFWADRNGTPVRLLPDPPRNFRVRQISDTSIRLDWDAPTTDSKGIAGDAATGYKVYMGTHGRAFPAGTPATGLTTTASSLTPGTIYYFTVTATNAGGESFPTEVLAAKLAPNPSAKKMLIVNGFDKLDMAAQLAETHDGDLVLRHLLYEMNTQDYIVEHARAIDASGAAVAFDSCDDESVGTGYVTLSDYKAVIWIDGIQAEVSTTDPTNDTALTSNQRNKLTPYLNGGGNLFITGAKIAWDLDRSGTTTFVDTSLRANYDGDNTDVFEAKGSSGSIFEGLSGMTFGGASKSPYAVTECDVLEAVNSSSVAMRYSNALPVTVDGFQDIGGWKDPNFSAQTNADLACTFDIVTTPAKFGGKSADLYYVWGTGDFIREYDSSLPSFQAASAFSVWVYGDGSGNQARLCLRDSDGELFVNPYMTIDFYGWRKIDWPDVAHNPGTRWSGSGDNVITGPNVQFDSIQISKAGAAASGHLYFDKALSTPTPGAETGPVAAVQYSGACKVVYVAFPFETIESATQRTNVMTRVLNFFFAANSGAIVRDWRHY